MFRQFIIEWREWNFHTAFGNLLWQIAYNYNDAKSMRVTYFKNTHRPYELRGLRTVK